MLAMSLSVINWLLSWFVCMMTDSQACTYLMIRLNLSLSWLIDHFDTFLSPFIDICNTDEANLSQILDPSIQYSCYRRGDPRSTIWIQAHSSYGLGHHRINNFLFSCILSLVQCYKPIAMAHQCWRLQCLKASAEVHSSQMHWCLGLTDQAKILHMFIWKHDASFPLVLPCTF